MNDTVEDSQELTPIRQELRRMPSRRNNVWYPAQKKEDTSKAIIIGSAIGSLMVFGLAFAVNERPILGMACAIFVVCITLFYVKR